ncbi:unnamed protein product [Clavelina lepadiformis]|uniref:Hydroxymethylglutaryl-CoA synthase n=1 Tax=Clavelina lepadiformis TaxID=159417 RepID=A0ABP0G117_CLALP
MADNCRTKVENVGILAIEVYFPNTYVDQSALEHYDKAPKGKYTIGLGQKEMGFCDDNEDVVSLCLTVVAQLMEKNKISYTNIGRLEVGTETLIDKSKSVKSCLMQLFEESGNFDVEGVDSINACYGGTNALFNAIAWVESSAWDGRLALVVCGDIAVYAKGNARCTGGAGSVAMLIGVNAPLVLDPGLRGTCIKHAYDFYKPEFTSEYPYVDGPLSVCSYLTALDACYSIFCQKAEKSIGKPFTLENFDYMVFHSPYCKLVQKSVARMALNDFIKNKTGYYPEKYSTAFKSLSQFRNVSLDESIGDRNIEKSFMAASTELFQQKTLQSLLLPSRVGNMYTSSLYSSLVSILISVPSEELINRRIGMFAYGSGFAASMFSITIMNPTYSASPKARDFRLGDIISNLKDVKTQLDNRKCFEPSEFTKALERRETTHCRANYTPGSSIEHLRPGTFYLSLVDEKYRRSYTRKWLSPNCLDQSVISFPETKTNDKVPDPITTPNGF